MTDVDGKATITFQVSGEEEGVMAQIRAIMRLLVLNVPGDYETKVSYIHSTVQAEGEVDISTLGLKQRTVNSLRRAKIHTVLDLTARTQDSLWHIKNIGDVARADIAERLAANNLTLNIGDVARADILARLADNGLNLKT